MGTLKCYDCGREVPANCGVRWPIATGYTSGNNGGAVYTNEFLCAPCAVVRKERRERWFRYLTPLSYLLAAIGILALVLLVVFPPLR